MPIMNEDNGIKYVLFGYGDVSVGVATNMKGEGHGVMLCELERSLPTGTEVTIDDLKCVDTVVEFHTIESLDVMLYVLNQLKTDMLMQKQLKELEEEKANDGR